MHNLSDNVELRYVGAAVANASNTDSNSSRIDMANYESAMFFTALTDSAATGVATLKIESSDDDADTNMAAITSATVSATCAINDDVNGTVLMVEVRNPAQRYIQGVRVSATANIAFGEVYVLLKPRRLPVTQHSTISASAYVAD